MENAIRIGYYVGKLILFLIKVTFRLLVSIFNGVSSAIDKYNANAPQREAARAEKQKQRAADAARHREYLAAEQKRRDEEERNRPKTAYEIERDKHTMAILNVRFQTEATKYASENTNYFLQQYDMLYKSGQYIKIPPNIVAAYLDGTQKQAVYNMLYNHWLNTGERHPSP